MVRLLLDRPRRAAVALGWLLAFAASPGWALGLGEIELDSALNQRFNATIELLDASGLEPTEILVSLGSSEDFERVGVERFFFLTDLRFEVIRGPGGRPQIRVTSTQPITEPYLNFLVEVLWPNGRLLKEFTVLLDPPTFSEAPSPVVTAPAQGPTTGDRGRVERVEPPSSGTRVTLTPPAERPSAPSPLDRGLSGDEYGMTDRDDTLWSIAKAARPSDAVSIQQTMLAIQRLNPQAFINGNINLLKAGYVLRLPEETQIQALPAQEALAEVAQHDADWRAYNRGEAIADRTQGEQPAIAADETSELRSTVDAGSSVAPAETVRRVEGELRIVAEDGDSTTGVGSELASTNLNAAMEETDRLGRQVDELTYQLDREKELATNEISLRDRQIEVKDQQIAELQSQLANLREQAEQLDTEENRSQNQSAPQTAETPWWQSPAVLYGGAGVLVLVLVVGMFVVRQRRAAAEENDYFDAGEAFAEDERREPAFVDDEDTVFLDRDDDEDEDFDRDRQAVAAAEAEESDDTQSSDVLGEADIYIAYGRFPQAIGLLTGVLEDEPQRDDVRLKLMEVYTETGDREAFDAQLNELASRSDDPDALRAAQDLRHRFGDEAISLEAATSEPATETAEAVPATEADEPTFEAALDEPPAEIELELEPEPEAETEVTDLAAGFAETEELSIDADLEEAAASISQEAARLDTSTDTDLALETSVSTDDDLLEGLDLEVPEGDEAFEFEDDGDSANTKLDLARAYIDMGDADGARDILKEVLDEGNSDQQQKAQSMLQTL